MTGLSLRRAHPLPALNCTLASAPVQCAALTRPPPLPNQVSHHPQSPIVQSLEAYNDMFASAVRGFPPPHPPTYRRNRPPPPTGPSRTHAPTLALALALTLALTPAPPP